MAHARQGARKPVPQRRPQHQHRRNAVGPPPLAMHAVFTANNCSSARGDAPSAASCTFTAVEKKRIGEALTRKLGNDKLAQRRGPGNSKVTYLEGWRSTELANEVFGFNGWRSKILSVHLDSMEVREDTYGRKYVCCYSAVVRVTVRACVCACVRASCELWLVQSSSCVTIFRVFVVIRASSISSIRALLFCRDVVLAEASRVPLESSHFELSLDFFDLLCCSPSSFAQKLKDGTYHDDIGVGTSDMSSRPMSMQKAMKEAVTDARKRALKNFGNLLGTLWRAVVVRTRCIVRLVGRVATSPCVRSLCAAVRAVAAVVGFLSMPRNRTDTRALFARTVHIRQAALQGLPEEQDASLWQRCAFVCTSFVVERASATPSSCIKWRCESATA